MTQNAESSWSRAEPSRGNTSPDSMLLLHQQILEILVDAVDAVDVIATHRHFIDFKYVKDIIGIL